MPGRPLQARDDRERLRLASRQPRPAAAWKRPRRRARASPAPSVGGGCEAGVHEPVGLGLEGADLLLAAGDDRQRRGLDAAQRDGAVEGRAQADRGRARRVHADDPVGLRARAGRLLEARELRAGRSAANASRIAALVIEDSHSRLTGSLRLGLLVQVGEDQLALAPGVAGVDDLVDVVAVQLLGDHRHLLARALVAHDELEALGHDRQVGHPPALELGVVLVGLGELDEVPDGPGDHVLRALEVALVLRERARSGRARGRARRTASRRSGGSSDMARQRSGGRAARVAQPLVHPSVLTVSPPPPAPGLLRAAPDALATP